MKHDKANMSLGHEQDLMGIQAGTAAGGPLVALERENEELRAVNEILAKKVIELEDRVAELQKAREADLQRLRVSDSLLAESERNADQDRQDLDPDSVSVSNVTNVPARKPSDGSQEEALPIVTSTFDPSTDAPPVRLPSFPWANVVAERVQDMQEDSDQDSGYSENARQSGRKVNPTFEFHSTTDDETDHESETSASEPVPSTKPARQVRLTSLPDYSPYLPSIDRTKAGEDFFADLYDKKLISGYDQDRFTCWCHVAKRAQNANGNAVLSRSHCYAAKKGGSMYRFQTSKWFEHAARCAFYKVSLFARLIPVTDPSTESLGHDGNGWNGLKAVPAIPFARTQSSTKSAGTRQGSGVCGFWIAPWEKEKKCRSGHGRRERSVSTKRQACSDPWAATCEWKFVTR